MKLLWFTWKDLKHPQAGGAERVNEEIARRLVRNSHEVTFVVGGFVGGSKEEIVDGYKIIRLGNRWTVYFKAWRYYRKHLKGKFDLVVDEVNTLPFFARWYTKEKTILFIHQLCREIWFYQLFFPLNWIGYFLEPIYLKMLRRSEVITVSQSTKADLIAYGYDENKINIISEGIEQHPYPYLPPVQDKESAPTLLYFGAFREMKRVDHIIKAFEIAKKKKTDLKLWLAGGGSGKYFQKCQSLIENSEFRDDISYFGRVEEDTKIELMTKAHILCVASVREGWGLIVTEANACGTPAVAYDVSGLRDSVVDQKTGLLCKENTPEGMAEKIIEILQDDKKYQDFREQGFEMSLGVTFERCYNDFLAAVGEK